MSKKKIISAVVLLMTLLYSPAVFAQGSTASATTTGNVVNQNRLEDVRDIQERYRIQIQNIKQNTEDAREAASRIKDLRAEEQGQIKLRNEEAKHRASQARETRFKEMLKKRAEQVLKRVAAHIDRLDKVAERIDSRIKKFEGTGSNMTESKTLLEKARVSITDARTALTELRTSLDEIVSQSQGKPQNELVKSVRGASDKVKEAIKTAHKALVDSVNSMKPGLRRLKNATSTAPTTTTP